MEVTATLSSGASAVVDSTGGFSFERVEAGTHTVAISGFPEDAIFVQSTRSATISTDGQNVRLSFVGEYVRSSAVVGRVSATGAAPKGGDAPRTSLSGVTVTLIGERGTTETTQTEIDGGFAFSGLRAGTYAVAISGFPEDISFNAAPRTVAVAVDEVGTVDFVGFAHASNTQKTITGKVIAPQGGGRGQSGVLLSATKVGDTLAVDTTTTDATGTFTLSVADSGQYRIEASKARFGFDYPGGNQSVSVSSAGSSTAFGDIQANTWTILDLTAERGTDSATVVLRFFSMKRESGRDYGFPDGHEVEPLPLASYRSEDGRFLPATFTFQDDDSRESAVVAVGHDGGAFPDDTFTVRVVVQSKESGSKGLVLDFAIETVVVPAKTDTPTQRQTITGKVIAPQGGGRGEAGVRVSATKVGDTIAADATTTDATGTFTLTVSDPGAYDVEASKNRYGFNYPNGSQRVSVAAGAAESFGDIQSNTWQVLDLTAERASDMTKVIMRFSSLKAIPGRDYGVPEGTTGGIKYTSQYRDVSGEWKHVDFAYHGSSQDAFLASPWQGGGQAPGEVVLLRWTGWGQK